MLTKTFAKVSNEKCLILGTRSLGNEWGKIGKKTFASPLLKYRREGKEKKRSAQAIAKLFVLHANAKNIFHDKKT